MGGRVVLSMIVSLDGFVNDKFGRVGALYPDLAALQTTTVMQDAIRDTGAVVMGRRAFAMGDPDAYAEHYEFQVPIFVLTHQPPQRPPKHGEHLSFTFVTDGIGPATARAKAAAGARDVCVIGGADVAQQVLNAGLVDELELGVASVLLGSGTPLFAGLRREIRLERTRVTHTPITQTSITQTPGTTFLRYRVLHDQPTQT